jgi:hypothetical protein
MVLHHFLVVAPTLVSSAALNRFAHFLVDFHDPPKSLIAFHHLLVLSQKIHVGYVLFKFPERNFEASLLPLSFFLSFRSIIMHYPSDFLWMEYLIRIFLTKDISLVLCSKGVQT